MNEKTGLSAAEVMDILQERDVICEMLGEGPDVRIRGGLYGLVYYVHFYDPVDAGQSRFASFSLQVGKNLELRVTATEMLRICNDLNNECRYCKFAFGGEEQQFATVMIDFDVATDPRAEFLRQWQRFEKVFAIFAQRLIATSSMDGPATQIHNEAIHARWGDSPDPSLAARLYRKAADMGFAGSQNNLGDMYESGEALPRSDAAAAYWYARAAERGEPTAYMSLSTLLSRIAPDEEMLTEAAMFALLALRYLPPGHNSTVTATCFADLRARLPAASMERAKQKAMGWLPLFQEVNLLEDTPDPEVNYSGSPHNTH